MVRILCCLIELVLAEHLFARFQLPKKWLSENARSFVLRKLVIIIIVVVTLPPTSTRVYFFLLDDDVEMIGA